MGRWASLASSAYYKGYIDYSTFNSKYPRDLSRELLAFAQVDKELAQEVAGIKALLEGLSPDNADDVYMRYLGVSMPWKPEEIRQAEDDNIQNLIQQVQHDAETGFYENIPK